MRFENLVRWSGDIDYEEYQEAMREIVQLIKNGFYPTLLIHSEGGFLPICIDFVEEVRGNELIFDTYVVGRVASAAIPVALMGKKRWMSRFAHIFFHDLQFRNDERKSEQKKEKNMRKWYIKAIAERSTLSESQVVKFMQKETLLNAENAKRYGLVDEIV